MLIKIISGYYHNITYSNDESVKLDTSKLSISDIRVMLSINKYDNDDNDKITLFLKTNTSILGIYKGKSRVDNSPIFLIDLAIEIRESIIEEILK